MDVSISVTYFMYCCIRHVFLFFWGVHLAKYFHTGIQFISAQLTIGSGVGGGPSTTVCSSDKFCLVVCNSSLLN